MSKEANIATAQKMGEAINKGNLEEFHQIFAPGVVDHDPAPDQGKGPDGFIGFFTQFRTAFPDLKVAVDHMVADEDNVAIAYTVTGTQNGPFQGVPATGKKIKARGMQIAKFDANARIVERWGRIGRSRNHAADWRGQAITQHERAAGTLGRYRLSCSSAPENSLRGGFTDV